MRRREGVSIWAGDDLGGSSDISCRSAVGISLESRALTMAVGCLSPTTVQRLSSNLDCLQCWSCQEKTSWQKPSLGRMYVQVGKRKKPAGSSASNTAHK